METGIITTKKTEMAPVKGNVARDDGIKLKDNSVAVKEEDLLDDEMNTDEAVAAAVKDENEMNPHEAAAEAQKSLETPKNDEFSYLHRNEFTSEIYKVEVRNLGYFGIGEFKKMLKNKLELDITKIKSPLRRDFAYICFRSQEDQERAIKTLNGYKWKGKELQAYIAKASADPLMKRRNEQSSTGSDQTLAKKPKTNVEATCPLASLPYEDQLQQKFTQMHGLLKKFSNELKRYNPGARKSLDNLKFEGITASPQVDGYRNKNEFTVGKNANGEIVVGFRLGSYADGSVEVSTVESLPQLPEAAKWGALSFQEFVRASKFLPFNPENNSGHYRQLMVRTSRTTDEIMLVAGIYSSNLSEEELEELKQELRAFYDTYDSSEFRCSSLYYQDVKHRQAGEIVNPVEHLAGTTHITDTILNLQFRISPLAFFQINPQSAGVLYQKAIDLAAPSVKTTVLDICCGTGTIALAFAKHCKQVLGVEIVEDAIKDAEYNAELNKIINCKFYAGNADDYIQSMVKEVVYGAAPGEEVDLVAIVDPPRNGLHIKSITAIRAAKSIKRLVYIACNPMRAQRNWIDLGRPESKQYKGDPFFPKKAVAVDMFPHTLHTEMVILFERQPNESIDEPNVVDTKPESPAVPLSYEDQLQQKSTQMQELLTKFANELKRNNSEAHKSLDNFKFEGIEASPQIDGYRNKNEFAVGKNVNGEIVVGFRYHSYAGSSAEVRTVESLPHLPEAAKWSVRSFQEFVRASKFLPFNSENKSGHFRQLMVRTSGATDEIMLVAGIYASNFSVGELEEFKQELKAFYETYDSSEFRCSSLFYQDLKLREAGQALSHAEHLAGTTHITDTILDLQFRISPLAFFPVNTQGAGVLYQKAIELAAPSLETRVLDICSGIGTVALAFAKHCKQVIGVEMAEDAIKDMAYNAELNKTINCKFYAGNAEDYIQSMVKEAENDAASGEELDLVAIVNPPRDGLRIKSITALRAAKSIKRLVYKALNPVRAVRNWVDLGRPKSEQYEGDPFFPKRAVAVDMFPHSLHGEMVILFERQ